MQNLYHCCMARTLGFVLIIFLSLQAFAQSAELDSLLKVLNGSPKRDSIRVDRLIDVHGHLILSDPSATLP